MQFGNWLHLFRHSVNAIYKAADFSERYIFGKNGLDAGECLMSSEVLLYKSSDPIYINVLFMHSPDAYWPRYHFIRTIGVEELEYVIELVYDFFDKLHNLPNTIHYDYVMHAHLNDEDSHFLSPFSRYMWLPLMNEYLEKEFYVMRRFDKLPFYIGEYKDLLSNIITMTSINVTFNSLYNWYNTNQSNASFFTPSQTVQYRYFINVNGSWQMSKNIGKTSSYFHYVNTPRNIKGLANIFGQLTHNGMYLQVLPNDVYFVVPKMLANIVYGDHYRLHHISSFAPDWNKTLTINNTIDIHRTFFDYRRSIHEPKCVFGNGINVPLKSYNLDWTSVMCHNKKPGTGYDLFGNLFQNLSEKSILETILSVPFNEDVRKIKAANTIAKAWREYKARGGRIVHYGKRSGLKIDNKYVKNTILEFHSTQKKIESAYVIMILHNSVWHYTFNLYGISDTYSFTKTYNNLDEEFMIREMNNYKI